jgi:hypothetical protein
MGPLTLGTPVVHTLTQHVDAIKGDLIGRDVLVPGLCRTETRQLESEARSAKW